MVKMGDYDNRDGLDQDNFITLMKELGLVPKVRKRDKQGNLQRFDDSIAESVNESNSVKKSDNSRPISANMTKIKPEPEEKTPM